jgi:hypothetical protein
MRNKTSKRIARAERKMSPNVLANMLEPYMLDALEWFRAAIREAMSVNDGPALRGASYGEHVDKKGWAFDHTAAQSSLYELFESAKRVDLDADGHVYKDFSIRDRREQTSVRTFMNGLDYASKSRRNLDVLVFLSILKYISSSRLDIIPVFEVTLIDSNIAKIMTTYRMDRKYVVAHLKGCLALIAMQKGMCNAPAAEEYIREAQYFKVHKNALTKKVRALCGL